MPVDTETLPSVPDPTNWRKICFHPGVNRKWEKERETTVTQNLRRALCGKVT